MTVVELGAELLRFWLSSRAGSDEVEERCVRRVPWHKTLLTL